MMLKEENFNFLTKKKENQRPVIGSPFPSKKEVKVVVSARKSVLIKNIQG